MKKYNRKGRMLRGILFQRVEHCVALRGELSKHESMNSVETGNGSQTCYTLRKEAAEKKKMKLRKKKKR